MRQGVDAGRRRDVRRQPGHQAGIERRHLRHQACIDDHQLGLAFRIRDHRGDGDFRAGAGGGGHGVDLDRRMQALEIAGQLAQRLAGVGYRGSDSLGGIHRGPAAEGHDGVAVVRLIEVDALLDQRNRRVGRDRIEDHVVGASRRQGRGQVIEQAQFGNDAVGDDEDLAVAEAGDGLAQSSAGARPDQDRGLRYGQKAHGQAGALHRGTECRGAKRIAEQIRNQGSSPPKRPPAGSFPVFEPGINLPESGTLSSNIGLRAACSSTGSAASPDRLEFSRASALAESTRKRRPATRFESGDPPCKTH